MTVTMQVLRAINGPMQGFGTNREIAGYVGRPQPSVRRATRVLSELGLLSMRATKFEGLMDYRITAAGQKAAKRETI
jgi:DNA-binding IclR family transcriptional regulator